MFFAAVLRLNLSSSMLCNSFLCDDLNIFQGTLVINPPDPNHPIPNTLCDDSIDLRYIPGNPNPPDPNQ